MRIATILQLGIKEWRGLRRDPVLAILIVYAFSVSLYAAAQAIPETLSRAAISVVDEDRSALSLRLTSAFREPYFTPPQVITPAEMDARMDAGLDTFALDIPPGFQRDLLAGRRPEIQLNVDATRMTQAYSGAGYVAQIVDGEVAEFLNRHRTETLPEAELVLRARFNPELREAWFGSITELIDMITMLSIILTGAALIRERERGTIEHLLVMPVTPAEIMVSKVWSMGVVVLLSSAFAIVVVVQGALGVPIHGSVPLFLLCTALHLFATTAMGIFLATVAGTMPQFGLLLMLVLLPLQMLSGGMTPRESMPDLVAFVMSAAPNTHFVSLAQAVLFRGAGIAVVWPQMLALCVIGTVLFALALRRFRAFLR